MIRPLKKNILIEVMKIDQTAMILVDEKEALMEKATIVSVGEEVENLKAGDVIFFKNYETDSIIDDKDEYVLISEDGVKAIYVKGD